MAHGVACITMPCHHSEICQTCNHPVNLFRRGSLQDAYFLSIKCTDAEYAIHPEQRSCLHLAHALRQKASAALEADMQLPVSPEDLQDAKKGMWRVVCSATAILDFPDPARHDRTGHSQVWVATHGIPRRQHHAVGRFQDVMVQRMWKNCYLGPSREASSQLLCDPSLSLWQGMHERPMMLLNAQRATQKISCMDQLDPVCPEGDGPGHEGKPMRPDGAAHGAGHK